MALTRPVVTQLYRPAAASVLAGLKRLREPQRTHGSEDSATGPALHFEGEDSAVSWVLVDGASRRRRRRAETVSDSVIAEGDAAAGGDPAAPPAASARPLNFIPAV